MNLIIRRPLSSENIEIFRKVKNHLESLFMKTGVYSIETLSYIFHHLKVQHLKTVKKFKRKKYGAEWTCNDCITKCLSKKSHYISKDSKKVELENTIFGTTRRYNVHFTRISLCRDISFQKHFANVNLKHIHRYATPLRHSNVCYESWNMI